MITAIVILASYFFNVSRNWLGDLEKQYAEERFNDVSLQYLRLIDENINHFLDDVDQLATFLSLKSDTSRFEFEQFTLKDVSKRDGVQAFQFVAIVDHKELDDFVNYGKTFYPEFTIKELTKEGVLKEVDKGRRTYYPILFASPYRENRNIIGYDPFHSLLRMNALNKAMNENKAAMSSTLEVFQRKGEKAVLIFAPVYELNNTESKYPLKGFAEGVFVVKDAVTQSVSGLNNFNLQLSIVDITGEPEEILSRVPLGDTEASSVINDASLLSMNMTVEYAGRQWEMTIHADINEFYYPLSVARYGILFIFLMVGAFLLYTIYMAYNLYKSNLTLQLNRSELKENLQRLEDSKSQLVYQAHHDHLTKLENRFALEARLRDLIGGFRGKESNVVCLIDLDKFKLVNDSYGQQAGNFVLTQISDLIKSRVGFKGSVARIGADEFLIVFDSLTFAKSEAFVRRLLDSIKEVKHLWQGMAISVGASAGLTKIDITTTNVSEVLSELTTACYIAKEKGGNRHHFYDKNDRESMHFHQQLRWVNRINNALDEGRFALRAQTIQSMQGEQNLQEVLVVMLEEDNKIIAPIEFIPAAERFQIMSQIDLWVINRVFEYLEANSDQNTSLWSINLSGASLNDEIFRIQLTSIISQAAIDMNLIIFEITETAAINNYQTVKTFMDNIKAYGCQFSLDDFGSGMSSYGYLRTLPIDYIKVDGSFITRMMDSELDFTIVKSICEISEQLNVKTVAEFVESEDIYNKVKDMGFDYAQGYFIEKPRII